MSVVSALTPLVLSVTANGFGKCTPAAAFPAKSRGTKGVIAIQTTERNGPVVASLPVAEGDQVMLVTTDGQVIRTRIADISVVGRNTQGVTLFKVEGKTRVYSACVIPAATLGSETEEPSELEAVPADAAAANASPEDLPHA